MMNYRKRCYDNFVSAHWQHLFKQSKEIYEFKAKYYAAAFGRFLPASKEARVLDVGCGPGHFLYFMKDRGYQNVSGIDISGEQLDAAREMGVKEVDDADFFSFLPAHAGQYDFIVNIDVIEHLTKDEVLSFLDGMFLALRPGGRIMIVTENVASLFGAGRVFMDFTHEQGFTPISLSQVLRVCGFENVEVHGSRPIHDLLSLIRVCLWTVVSAMMKVFIAIESGLGRGMLKRRIILEPRMIAVATKPATAGHSGGAS